MARPNEPHGIKLHENKEIENQVKLWILEDPLITDYAISQRLEKELGFSFSSPSVNSWRNNFFLPERLKFQEEGKKLLEESAQILDVIEKGSEIEEDTPITEDNFNKEVKKVTLALKLLDYLQIIEARINHLKDKLNESTKKDSDKPFTSKDEEILRDYIQIAVGINDKLFKHASETTPGEIIDDCLKKAIEQVFHSFPVNVGTESYFKKFKSGIGIVEKLLQNKYILKVK